MSGAHGWGGNDRSYYNPLRGRDDFDSAWGAYNTTPQHPPRRNLKDRFDLIMDDSVVIPTPPTPLKKEPLDLSPKLLKSTKENVLIVMMDMTGSMGEWREDIFKFLVNLYEESQKLLGESLEILFITFGDAKYWDPIQVATFGSGPELDQHLAAFTQMNGGGDGEESPELAAYYVLQSVDVSSAKNAFCYIITDEAAASFIHPEYLQNTVNLALKPELHTTQQVLRALLRKMEVFVILKPTENVGYNPKNILQFWETNIGAGRICPLERANLVVETMLASMARRTDQDERFNASYHSRRGGTQFGAVNYALVQKSVAMIPSSATAVTPPGPGTRNLLDFLED